jgi:hypothetical protein
MKIEINSEVDADLLKYALQNQLTTSQLVDFVMELGSSLTDEEEYYKRLLKKLIKKSHETKNR